MDAIPPPIILPPHLPAQCFSQPAADYKVPEIVLVALTKVESKGKSVVGKNSNGSFDLGVAQHNTGSWVPFLQKKFGITPESLLNNPCQSIRAAAYVLRVEMNHKKCAGQDIWCGIGRYHSPNNPTLAAIYISKINDAITSIVSRGRY